MNKPHGGARKGAGRPKLKEAEKVPSTVVRVPNAILAIVRKLIADFKKSIKSQS